MLAQKQIIRVTAASLFALALCEVPAIAQQTSGPVEGESAGGIGDIVVTAQKRAERIQDIPASITALGAEDLETRQINSLVDLQSQVPSLVVGNLFGTNLITLRGISTSVTSGLDDPSVATHINGAYQPRSRSIAAAMVDLERVEVLSGPQGTLYGRNATGGAVNYVLRGPSRDFEAEVTGRVGNYKRWAVEGSVSAPLGEHAGIRVTGLYDDQAKGFTKILNADAPVRSIEDNRTYGGRVILRVEPTADVTVDLETIYAKSESSTIFAPLEPSGSPAVAAVLEPQFFGAHKAYTSVRPVLDSRYHQSIATMSWDLSDDVSVKSITAYQTFRQDMTIDYQGSGDSSRFGPIVTRSKSDTFTQEFNISADLFDGKLKSIFGAFYYDDDVQIDTIFQVGRVATGTTIDQYSRQNTKSYAFFTDQTLTVAKGVRVIAGIRYSKDKKAATQSAVANGVAVLLPLQTNKASFDAWTPRIGIQIDVAPETMAYAQYSKGFKAGGYVANVTAVNSYKPETIEGAEVGLKTELFDRRVRFNLAGYYYNYSDLQVNAAVLINGIPTYRVRNAASSKIYGAEVQTQFMVSDALKLDLSGMVQSAKYKDFITCDSTAFIGACSAANNTTLINVKGNWLNRAAPYSLNVGAEYVTPIANGKLRVRGESFFSGKIRFNEFGSSTATQGAYDTQNLFVTYSPDSNDFTLRAYIKNIADTKYKTSALFNNANVQFTGNWGAPRTFGAEATIRF